MVLFEPVAEGRENGSCAGLAFGYEVGVGEAFAERFALGFQVSFDGIEGADEGLLPERSSTRLAEDRHHCGASLVGK